MGERVTSAERWERIVEYTDAGFSRREIAEKIGICPESLDRIRRRHGLGRPPRLVVVSEKPRRTRRPFTAEEVAFAEMLLDDGASYAEVGRTLGRSGPTIRWRFKGRSQWKPNVDGGRWGAYLRWHGC